MEALDPRPECWLVDKPIVDIIMLEAAVHSSPIIPTLVCHPVELYLSRSLLVA